MGGLGNALAHLCQLLASVYGPNFPSKDLRATAEYKTASKVTMKNIHAGRCDHTVVMVVVQSKRSLGHRRT